LPRAEAVELALAELPGVELAVFSRDENARGSLRIRVAPGHNPSLVAEEVSQTLRARFSIDVPAESLIRRPRQPAAAIADRGEDATVDLTGEQADPPVEVPASEVQASDEPPAPDEDRRPVAASPSDSPDEDVIFRVEQLLGSSGKEIRIVDAAVEGEGLARRAVVILNQTGPEGGHTAMGASLVAASEALAVATATLQALSELD